MAEVVHMPTCAMYTQRQPLQALPDVVLMLARRLRRRYKIKTTLGQCIQLAGVTADQKF